MFRSSKFRLRLQRTQRGRIRHHHLSMLLLFAAAVMVLKHVLVRIEPAESYRSKQSKHLIVDLPHSNDSEPGVIMHDSFFDCQSKESRCRYFNPNQFFDSYFSSYINDVHLNIPASEQLLYWRNDIGLENVNLPALTSSSWWASFSDTEMGIIDQKRIKLQIDGHFGFSPNLTYIHMHKCGGTSIQSALAKRASYVKKVQFNASIETHAEKRSMIIGMHSNVHHFKHSYGGGSAQKKEKWDKDRIDHILALTQAVNRTKENQINHTAFPIFTVMRDPANRFLSAVQQVMHYNIEFRSKCLQDQPHKTINANAAASARRQLINCAIDDMNETNYRRDVHLLPMASHFRLFDGNNRNHLSRNIYISVFYMNDLEYVLSTISDKGKKPGSQSAAIHARDRSNEEYATSPILAKLSVADFTNDAIEKLCVLYHVDYVLLKSLGLGLDAAVERCIKAKPGYFT